MSAGKKMLCQSEQVSLFFPGRWATVVLRELQTHLPCQIVFSVIPKSHFSLLGPQATAKWTCLSSVLLWSASCMSSMHSVGFALG